MALPQALVLVQQPVQENHDFEEGSTCGSREEASCYSGPSTSCKQFEPAVIVSTAQSQLHATTYISFLSDDQLSTQHDSPDQMVRHHRRSPYWHKISSSALSQDHAGIHFH
jgi:hypothetical protein